MIVFGKYCFNISKYDKEAIVNAFTDQVGTITVPVFDAAVAYECSGLKLPIYLLQETYFLSYPWTKT